MCCFGFVDDMFWLPPTQFGHSHRRRVRVVVAGGGATEFWRGAVGVGRMVNRWGPPGVGYVAPRGEMMRRENMCWWYISDDDGGGVAVFCSCDVKRS